MDQPGEKSTPALQEILACRVCLATTGKMLCIEACGLKQAFFDITGIQVFLGDGLPQHLCYICCGLLRKATEFRNKCQSTTSLLLSLPLTLDLIKQVNLLHGQPFKKTKTLYINMGEELVSDLNDTNLENDVNNGSSETDSNVEEVENGFTDNKVENNLNDEGTVNDLNVFDQSDVDLTTGNDLNNDELTSMLHQEKDSRNKDEVAYYKENTNPNRFNRDVADKNVTEYISNDPTADPHTKMFYKYIEDKYFKGTWKDKATTDEDRPLSNLAVSARNNTLIISHFDLKANRFYDFLRDQYGYIDTDRDAAVKLLIDDAVGKQIDFVYKKQKQIDETNAARKFGEKYNCEVLILSKEEQIRNVQERMESDGYKCAPYKCEDCYAWFQFEQKYNNHRARHNTSLSGDYECEVCKLKFHLKTRLGNHISQCHKYRYICKECGKHFASKMYYIEHYQQHKGGAAEIVYECERCSKHFKKLVHYKDHVRLKHGTVFCDICQAKLTPRGLPQHVRMQHKETFVCETCEKVFNDSAALDKHIKTSPNGVCDPNYWPCTKCGENHSSEILLREHIEWHRRRGPKDGKRAFSRERKYGSVMCEWCGRSCQSMACLKAHLRVHTGEKPYQCDACPKRFRLKMQLQLHSRTHTGEKPFQCPDCPKAFQAKSNLARHHYSIHAKLRPYACPICHKTYQQSTAVKIHVRTVHMNIPMPPRVRKRTKENRGDGRRVGDDKEVKRDAKRRIVDLADIIGRYKDEGVSVYNEEDKIDSGKEVVTVYSEQEIEESCEVGLEDELVGYEEVVEICENRNIGDCEDYEKVEFLEEWKEFGDEVIIAQCHDHNYM